MRNRREISGSLGAKVAYLNADPLAQVVREIEWRSKAFFGNGHTSLPAQIIIIVLIIFLAVLRILNSGRR